MTDKYEKWIRSLEDKGYAYAEIIDDVPNVKVPKRFFDWCHNYGIKPSKMLKLLVLEFLSRTSSNNKETANSFFGVLMESDKLSNREKKIIKEIFYGDNIEIRS